MLVTVQFSKIEFAALLNCNGDKEIRTLDPLLARQVLSQLSYTPMVGLSGLEPPTSRLSGVRSNRLSYRPMVYFVLRECCSLKIKQPGDLSSESS